jgi:transcriptional regulator with XRE-family HTH domain
MDPARAGLPQGKGRRTAGLRREELAVLARLSVDYVVRLEQGRASSPSVDVLAALGDALALNATERESLFRAAGHLPRAPRTVPATLSPGVRELIARMTSTPVGVFTAAITRIASNVLWDAIFGEVTTRVGREANVAWAHFTGLPGPALRGPAEVSGFEASLVSDLRAASLRYPEDEELAGMVSELMVRSARFKALWARADLVGWAPQRKTMRTPVGPIEFHCDLLTMPAEDLRIMVYTVPDGTADGRLLEKLVRSMAPPGERRSGASSR